jgi:hypothetical protein
MRARIARFFLLGLLLLTCCGGCQAGIQVDTLKVTGSQILNITSKDSYLLSPDGTRFAALVDNKVCIFAIDGTQQACSEEISPEMNALAWSSDSQKVAFSEEFLRFLLEPDLYVLQSNGNQQNLTQDSVEGNALKPGSIDQADIHPAWYAMDGKIAFLRYSNTSDTNGSAIHLMSIASGGGEAVELATWESDHNDTFILDSSPAGWLLYGHGNQLYRFDPATAQNTLLFSNNETKQRIANTARISADGNYIMLWIQQGYLLMPYFLSTDGKGEPIPLSADPKKLTADAAGWAPSGSAYAFVGNDRQNNQQGLFVVQEPGKTPKFVQSGQFRSSYKSSFWIDWASNNTLLLIDAGTFKPLLLQLGQ